MQLLRSGGTKKEREHRAELQVDGKSVRMMEPGDRVHVTGAAENLHLVRMSEYRFFDVMKQKFLAWSQPGKEDRQS